MIILPVLRISKNSAREMPVLSFDVEVYLRQTHESISANNRAERNIG